MIYDGEIVERGGYRFRVNFEPDTDRGPPWEDGDGRGIVRELGYGENKRPGDRVIHHDRRETAKWVFEWDNTMAKAKAESWGLGDDDMAVLKDKLGRVPTKGEITERSVQREFDHFRDWFRDDWEYVGIVITHIPEDESDEGVEPDYDHAVWGFESNDQLYLTDEADGMIDEYVSELDKQKADSEAAEARALALDSSLVISVTDIAFALHSLPMEPAKKRELQDELLLLARAAGVMKNGEWQGSAVTNRQEGDNNA